MRISGLQLSECTLAQAGIQTLPHKKYLSPNFYAHFDLTKPHMDFQEWSDDYGYGNDPWGIVLSYDD
jgi:hypothetical protein